MKTQDKILITLGTAAVIAVSGIVGYGLFVTPDQTISATSSSQVSSTGTVATSSDASSTNSEASSSSSTTETESSYKDGTYTATSSYSVPKGEQNSITATVTISGGKVTNVNTSNDYSDHESGRYIDWFEQEIATSVTGKNIGDVSVSRVGGASLTSFAFNDALDTIRSQAKV